MLDLFVFSVLQGDPDEMDHYLKVKQVRLGIIVI